MIKRYPRPVGPRILVKLKAEAEKKSDGGIILQTQAAAAIRPTVEAYVMNMSELAFRDYEPYKDKPKVGDLVKIIKYSGEDDRTIEDNEVYQIINDIDVIAIMTGEGLND